MLRNRLSPLLNGEYSTELKSMHAGLWMDKFLPGSDFGCEDKSAHIRALEKQSLPIGYKEAYKTRATSFVEASVQNTCRLLYARALGRLVIGLGAKGVLEAGLRVEPTWGVPVLPGSALKGLAAAAAHQLVSGDWKKSAGWPRAKAANPPSSFENLFGTRDAAGLVIFHDAWWVPDENYLPFAPDIMTVHHGDYYQSKGKPPAPTDFDTPTPVAFMTVTGRYLVVLEGEENWCRAAEKLLELGLSQLGIGAKTSAGYGRMNLEEPFDSEIRQIPTGNPTKTWDDLRRFKEFPEARMAIRKFIEQWEKACPNVHEQAQRLSRDRKDFHQEFCPRFSSVQPAIPPSTGQKQPSEEKKPEWKPALGWVEDDKKGRPFLKVRIDNGPLDRKAKDVQVGDSENKLSEDKELLAKLRAATESSPLRIQFKLDGARLRRVKLS